MSAGRGSRSPARLPFAASPPGSVGHVEKPQRPLLLEVERPGGWRPEPAEAPGELGRVRANPWLRQHPQSERQRRRADVVAPLDVEGQGDRVQVLVGELPVRRRDWRRRGTGLAGCRRAKLVTDPGQQPKGLPVSEHPG
jgi:hypothetical protein